MVTLPQGLKNEPQGVDSMNAKGMVRLLCLAGLWAGYAFAQVAGSEATGPAADCPVFPEGIPEPMRWEAMRANDILFCRAITTETGKEAFTLTFSRESPFRPRRGNRAEPGEFGGKPMYWYRGEMADAPNALIRETLLELDDQHVLHIFMRVDDAETLARYQQLVLALPLTPR